MPDSFRHGTVPNALPNALPGALPVLTAAMLWGTTGTASTFAPAGVPPAAIGSAGLALGGLLLFLGGRRERPRAAFGRRERPQAAFRRRERPQAAFRRRERPQAAFRDRERWLLTLGALAVPWYPLTFYPAVARAGVAVATVIALGSAPVFAGLLAWLTGQGRPAPRWAVATLAAVAGCALLVTGPLLAGHASHGGVPVSGVVLSALSGLSYAAYSLIGGRLIARGFSANRVMGAMFGGGALLVLPVLVSSGPQWLATIRGAAVTLHLAVFTTFIAYRLFGRGLRSTSAQVATTLTLAEPAVATVLGIALLHERLPAVSWAGMATLAAGLAMLAVPASKGGFRWQRRLPRGSTSVPSPGCAPPACTRK